MAHNQKIATIFGGTGFVGKQIVRELAARGITIKVATRIPESAYFLKPHGAVGQIVPFACDYSDAQSVANAVKGADYVVNCIGILYEKGKTSKFQRAHVDIPAMIAKVCADEGVDQLVHISALGCESGTSSYAKTKFEGEKAVMSNFPDATILRPSVIFGPDDNFFNMFAELSRYLPFLPLIGGGETKFQPVYVGDVADAAIKALMSYSPEYKGKIYELGGPDVVNFKEVYELLFKYTGRTRKLVALPFCVAKAEAVVLGLLPKPLLTRDQVESLKTDTIVSEGALDFESLGVTPTSMDLILPEYLSWYRVGGGRFDINKAV